MTMTIDQAASTPARRFWRTWRREIVRGGVLFGLVVGAGLFIRSIRIHVPSPLGALGAFGDFNWGDGDGGDLFGRGRQVGDPWEYRTLLKPNQQVWIRNTNGPIDVVSADGDSLVIQVEKSWRMSDPQSVQLVPVPSERGLTVCAVWESRESFCNDGGVYKMNGPKKNDVAVRFTVQLPRHLSVDVSTVNGGLEVSGASAPVNAKTVNGRVTVSTTTGPVEATSVNGSIETVILSATTGDVRLSTVNGSVTAALPRELNADIDAQTVNGRVETVFPVRVSGKISPRHLRGTIGNGGPSLKLITVNGSITLHESDAEHPTPHAPRAPRARATPAPTTPTPDRP